MTETEKLTKKFQGWFATSFWVDVHYGLAALGTLVVFGIYIFTHPHEFNALFAGFDVGLWTTAIAGDKVNMPAVPPTN